jgi:hypothetical protein
MRILEAGGLVSYGPNIPDLFRRAAEFVTIFATQLGRTGADEVIK